MTAPKRSAALGSVEIALSFRGADFFGDGFGLEEEQQVILAAGFGIGAGHIEAAEGMGADHGAGAFAVHVQIADVEFFGGALNFFGILGIDGAGQAEFGVVGHVQGFVKIFRFGDGEHGAENFFLKMRALGLTSAMTVGSMK